MDFFDINGVSYTFLKIHEGNEKFETYAPRIAKKRAKMPKPWSQVELYNRDTPQILIYDVIKSYKFARKARGYVILRKKC